MTTSHPHLLSPITIGATTLRNRVIMGSMHVGLEDKAKHLPDLAAYFAERAKGGVALSVTGGFAPTWRGWLLPFGSQMTTRRHADAHRVVTDAVGGSTQEAHDAALNAIHYLQRDALVTAEEVQEWLATATPNPEVQRALATTAQAV